MSLDADVSGIARNVYPDEDGALNAKWWEVRSGKTRMNTSLPGGPVPRSSICEIVYWDRGRTPMVTKHAKLLTFWPFGPRTNPLEAAIQHGVSKTNLDIIKKFDSLWWQGWAMLRNGGMRSSLMSCLITYVPWQKVPNWQMLPKKHGWRPFGPRFMAAKAFLILNFCLIRVLCKLMAKTIELAVKRDPPWKAVEAVINLTDLTCRHCPLTDASKAAWVKSTLFHGRKSVLNLLLDKGPNVKEYLTIDALWEVFESTASRDQWEVGSRLLADWCNCVYPKPMTILFGNWWPRPLKLAVKRDPPLKAVEALINLTDLTCRHVHWQMLPKRHGWSPPCFMAAKAF